MSAGVSARCLRFQIIREQQLAACLECRCVYQYLDNGMLCGNRVLVLDGPRRIQGYLHLAVKVNKVAFDKNFSHLTRNFHAR